MEQAQCSSIVSQLSIVSFILSHSNLAGATFHKPIIEAGLIPQSIVGAMDEEINVMGAMRCTKQKFLNLFIKFRYEGLWD